MPSNRAKYASLDPQARAEQEKPWAFVMCSSGGYYTECNVPGCSGVESFPWCTKATRDPEEAELWGEQHVREMHWQPVGASRR